MTDIRDTFRTLTSDQKLRLQERILPAVRRPLRLAPHHVAQARDGLFAVSPSQRRLWFLESLDGPSDRYVLCLPTRVSGPFEFGRFAAAVTALGARHEAFRTAFIETENGLRQKISPTSEVSASYRDLGHLPMAEAERAGIDLLRQAATEPFDLSKGQLLRALAVRLAPDEHLLMLVTHHIVADGWSLQVLKEELLLLYQNIREADRRTLPELELQFADYAQGLAEQPDEGKLQYWVDELSDAPAVSRFPIDGTSDSRSPAGGAERVAVAPDLWRSIQALARRSRVTPFVVLLSAFKFLLARYVMQDDVVIGTSTANRGRPELARVIGCFAETIPVRSRLRTDETVGELLREVHEKLLDAQEHADVPFEAIVDACKIPRSPDQHPLFDIMFELETGHHRPTTVERLRLTPVRLPLATPKFDMNVEVHESGDGLEIWVEYRSDLYQVATVARLFDNYRRLLECFVADGDRELGAISFISDEERKLVLETWAKGPQATDVVSTAHELFEAQADKTPERVAIVCGERTWSYADIESRSNRLANALRSAEIGKGSLVGLMVGREARHLIGMLGVLKAGAAFVPLSAEWPQARLADVIRDSGLAAVVALQPMHLSADDVKIISWSSVEATSVPDDRPSGLVGADDLAYAIFTSGSTGTPKAAMIEHAGMVNHLLAKVAALGIDQESVIAQIAITTFDVSIWQYLAALVVGGRVVVLEGDEAWDPTLLLTALARHDVTIVESVPSHTQLLLQQIEFGGVHYDLSSLRLYVSNGEALTVAQARRWLELVPNVPIANTYGITEVSDDVTHHIMTAPPSEEKRFVPIGSPIRNSRLYILDEKLRPVPIGAIGEIVIGGTPVGRGYLNAPEKTLDRFVRNSYAPDARQRLYRTGDLAKRCSDGEIEFLGRRDHQVKIRGHRIEIGEIEATLTRCEGVASAAVVVCSTAGVPSNIVAFIAASEPGVNERALALFCADRLPFHMRPNAFQILAALPLTATGKIDRNGLQRMLPENSPTPATGAQPTTEEEYWLRDVWEEMLKRRGIGIEDNFFDLGGHSLLLAEMVSRLRRKLQREVRLRDAFDAPTIRSLLARVHSGPVEGARLDRVKGPTARDRKSAFKLAPCQIPEWFAYQLAPNSPVYNISFTELFLTGLDPDLFVAAWNRVIARHDIFRTQIRYVDGAPTQIAASPIALDRASVLIDRTGLRGAAILEEAARFSREWSETKFDFETGRLFRVGLVEYGDGRHQFLFVVHHVIWDETSSMNLIRELTESYNAIAVGREARLPELKLKYSDYVEWIDTCLSDGSLADDRSYWIKLLADPPPPLRLPTDFERPIIQDYAGDSLLTWLQPAEVARVRAFCQAHDVTLFMFFLAVIQLYLARLTGSQDFVIGCPIAGRDYPELKPLLGLFATPMPIRWKWRDGLTFLDMVKGARSASIDAYEHYLYPATAVIEEIECGRDLSRSRLFSVMYGLQNNKTELMQEARFDGVGTEIMSLYGAEAHAARFDLTFAVEERDELISINCTYATGLFQQETVSNWMSGLSRMLSSVLDDPALGIHTYSILSVDDENKIFGASAHDTTHSETGKLHAMFAEQAARHPRRPCVHCDSVVFPFEEIDRWSSRLARLLRARGVSPGDRVGLVMGARVELIVSELAVLKAGACFVPFGSDGPPERMKSVCSLIAVKCTVSCDEELGVAPIHINLKDCQQELQTYSDLPIDECESSSAFAYILHTSGSTGTPKAIPVTHAAAADIVKATDRAYELTPDDIVGAFTSPLFDPSILDIFWPLSTGGQIALPYSEGPVTPEAFLDCVVRRGATIAQCVPAMLKRLIAIQANGGQPKLKTLRLLIVGGAILTRSLRDDFQAHFDACLANHYGPTEAAIDVARFDCRLPFAGDIVPIGRGLPGVQLWVLDAHGQPMPAGAEGELYISCSRLSSGYIGLPEQSAKAFPSISIGGRPTVRVFRTGDMAKWLASGDVVVLGRVDRQVKQGGARVELDEIDLALGTHAAVGNSFTTVTQGGLLAAFVEPKSEYSRLQTRSGPYHLFTREQRPDRAKVFTTAHLDAWPAFFEGDLALKADWGELGSVFPEYQMCLLSEDDRIAAVVHSAPFHWSGLIDDLPAGWSAALRAAVRDQSHASGCNTLLVFVAVVAREFQQLGLSLDLLSGLREFAAGKGLGSIIIPVRPTEKASHPHMPFDAYCRWRREDGQLVDPWLRSHERQGGVVLRVENRSQTITGSFADWQRWTGCDLSAHPEAVPPGAFNPLVVDEPANSATYVEPCVWIRHNVRASDGVRLGAWSITDLRAHLSRRLPSYMIPHHVQVLDSLPRTSSGKVDPSRLPPIGSVKNEERQLPTTERQKELCGIWRELLSVDVIGVTCDFFMAGGRSLDVVRMLAVVEGRYGQKILLRDFYADTTVRGLERILRSAETVEKEVRVTEELTIES
ncbi:non-ribosomal peptide synthetase [Bradyrhizobium sp. SZCCHNR2035]|uniref:non-ribosomal peptide synthetase n=1 Tax=Bradyrhizobium sp. SZCCHNR2035 TaxID=3057386 RepID=UPI002916E69C|nr:non-ribosomal peptide synthetase [Bradyrhizobium sp. SZCCHNR2035]